jgi:hypothetical protein
MMVELTATPLGWILWWPVSVLGFVGVLVAAGSLESRTGIEDYDISMHDQSLCRTQQSHLHSSNPRNE